MSTTISNKPGRTSSNPVHPDRLRKYGLQHFRTNLTIYEQTSPWSQEQQETLERLLKESFNLRERISGVWENTKEGVGYEDYRGGKFWVYCSYMAKPKIESIIAEAGNAPSGDVRQTETVYTKYMKKHGFTIEPNGGGYKDSEYFRLAVVPTFHCELRPAGNPGTTNYHWFKGESDMIKSIENFDRFDQELSTYSWKKGLLPQHIKTRSRDFTELFKKLIP